MTDFNSPNLTTTYPTVLTELKNNIKTTLTWDLSSSQNLPVGAKQFINNRFEQWDGSAWQPLTSQYNINVSQLGGKTRTQFDQEIQANRSAHQNNKTAHENNAQSINALQNQVNTLNTNDIANALGVGGDTITSLANYLIDLINDKELPKVSLFSETISTSNNTLIGHDDLRIWVQASTYYDLEFSIYCSSHEDVGFQLDLEFPGIGEAVLTVMNPVTGVVEKLPTTPYQISGLVPGVVLVIKGRYISSTPGYVNFKFATVNNDSSGTKLAIVHPGSFIRSTKLT